jgi:hypothetical protein
LGYLGKLPHHLAEQRSGLARAKHRRIEEVLARVQGSFGILALQSLEETLRRAKVGDTRSDRNPSPCASILAYENVQEYIYHAPQTTTILRALMIAFTTLVNWAEVSSGSTRNEGAAGHEDELSKGTKTVIGAYARRSAPRG